MKNRIALLYVRPGSNWHIGPQRQVCLADSLSKHILTVYINMAPYSTAMPSLQRPYVERIHDNLLVVHNVFALRYNRFGKRMAGVAGTLDAAWLHAALRKEGVEEYVYVLGSADPTLMPGMRLDRLVYDCVDPCFVEADQANFDAIEFATARKAKMVICTAETLYERMKAINPHSYLVPNAINEKMFHPDHTGPTPLPSPLQGRPHPIVGYIGTVDWRVDSETLYEVARQIPEYTFAIVGRVNPDQEPKFSRMRNLPNVVAPGRTPDEDGATWNNAFDVGLIPYHPGYIGDAINSVKTWGYLLAGMPVVSTWVRESVRYAPYIATTRTVDEFVRALRHAVEDDDPAKREARKQFARENSWDARAEAVMHALTETGLLS